MRTWFKSWARLKQASLGFGVCSSRMGTSETLRASGSSLVLPPLRASERPSLVLPPRLRVAVPASGSRHRRAGQRRPKRRLSTEQEPTAAPRGGGRNRFQIIITHIYDIYYCEPESTLVLCFLRLIVKSSWNLTSRTPPLARRHVVGLSPAVVHEDAINLETGRSVTRPHACGVVRYGVVWNGALSYPPASWGASDGTRPV